MDAVESRFPGNVFGVAGEDESGIANLVVHVLLHPEPVDGLADPDADLGGAAEGSAIDALADGGECDFGRFQQGFAGVARAALPAAGCDRPPARSPG